jgi:hypothetical protein
VIRHEKGPYKFKILLFPEDQNYFSREIEADMKEELEGVLSEYGVDQMKFKFTTGQKNSEKKLICHFTLNDQKSALQCFDEISKFKRYKPLP